MTIEVWQCSRCSKLHIQLPDGKRGAVGYREDVCDRCSVDQADEDLEFVPESVRWLVTRLRTELETERRERAREYVDIQREVLGW